MKNKLILTVLILILTKLSSFSQSGWFVTSPDFTSTNGVHNIKFLNKNTGFCTLLAGYIYRTTNGGMNWNLLGSNGGNSMFNILIFDSLNIYLTAANGVFKSTNLGINWSGTLLINQGYIFIRGIHFPDMNTGYVSTTNPASIFKTTNAGMNWINNNSIITSGFYSLYFMNSLTGYGVGTYDIMKTTDGGVNWFSVYNQSNLLREIIFTNSSTGYCCGWNGTILETTDSGLNWFALNSSTTASFNTIDFLNSETGYVGGSLSGSGVFISKTTDGGINWNPQAIPDSNVTRQILDVCFINKDTIFACGSAGQIYRTNTGGIITAIKNLNNNYASEYRLFQNYPNPFNPVTKIKYDIPKAGFTELKVFDITGREVKTLVNTNLKPGSYAVEFKGTDLPSGVYFYTLKVNDYKQTKKMLVIK